LVDGSQGFAIDQQDIVNLKCLQGNFVWILVCTGMRHLKVRQDDFGGT
jgi:hypothetical protein